MNDFIHRLTSRKFLTTLLFNITAIVYLFQNPELDQAAIQAAAQSAVAEGEQVVEIVVNQSGNLSERLAAILAMFGVSGTYVFSEAKVDAAKETAKANSAPPARV